MPEIAASTYENRTNVRVQGPLALRGSFRLMSHVAPETTGRLAARLFTHVHGAHRTDPREPHWLADATPFELDAGGRRLAAWSWGDGPTVLLQHGWRGRGAQLGAFVSPLLDAGFSVVTYDAPAHGASPGRFTNGVEFARTIAAASRELHGLHAVVAHSLGSLSTAYALRRPLPIERLVFVGPPADMSGYLGQFSDAVGLTDQVRDLMRSHFETTLDMDWNEFCAERLAEADRRARGRQTPLLIVHDRGDRQAPWEDGRRYHESWEDSRFLSTSGLGHKRILSDDEVVRTVVDFLVAT